jgi:hypothetical protein
MSLWKFLELHHAARVGDLNGGYRRIRDAVSSDERLLRAESPEPPERGRSPFPRVEPRVG